jgi:hypothetical protein
LSQLFITKIVPFRISTDVEKMWKNHTPPVHGASLGTGCRSGKCLDCPHPLVLVFPSLLETPCVLTLRDSAQRKAVEQEKSWRERRTGRTKHSQLIHRGKNVAKSIIKRVFYNAH